MARALQQSPAFEEYRRLRVVVEHRLARLVQLGIRQARYIGRVKTKFQLYLASTVANLTLLGGRLGLTGPTGSGVGGSVCDSSLIVGTWRPGTLHLAGGRLPTEISPPKLGFSARLLAVYDFDRALALGFGLKDKSVTTDIGVGLCCTVSTGEEQGLTWFVPSGWGGTSNSSSTTTTQVSPTSSKGITSKFRKTSPQCSRSSSGVEERY